MVSSIRVPSPVPEPAENPEPSRTLKRALDAEKILEQISRSVKGFAIVVLTPDGRIDYWNEGAERLFGYTSHDVHGQFGRILFTPEDQERTLPEEELRRAASEGQADDTRFLVRKDGSRFWAGNVSTPVRGASGQLEGFVKVLRDETPSKALEEELRRENRTLEERLRQRTEDFEDTRKELAAFSYSIAHDLKAPLRAMTGFAQVLAEDYRDSLGETGQAYAARISEAAKFMNRMIEDLLTYSQLTRSEVQCHPIDPIVVLDGVLKALAPDIQRTNAEVHVARPFPKVLAQEITLGQVFTNLISNALKFVAAGIRPRIRIAAQERDDCIRIWVEDNGIGVALEYRQKIFEIFERLNPADYPGTGMGLAIVNRAIERMRGRVGVEAADTQGSRFWIELRKVAER